MNKNLHNAKIAKNDEFYTQYSDIQKEVELFSTLKSRITELLEIIDDANL